jgi:phage replication-related protein YjqB (UPF0714/DUF867 family)
MRDVYHSYAELLSQHREGADFDRTVLAREGAKVAILAPHGGRLENFTDTIAESVAGSDFSLYCFRSKLGWGQTNLHITSHKFDDPECVALVARHPWAVALHGCSEGGDLVFIGGRDQVLIDTLASGLQHAGIQTSTAGHAYPGQHPNNICNRTASKAGAQIEMTLPFRKSGAVPVFVAAVRNVLLARQGAGGLIHSD